MIRGYKQCWRTDIFVFHYGGFTANAILKDTTEERKKGQDYIKGTRTL
jgi:hypothetical protein